VAVLVSILCAAAVFAWLAPPVNVSLENSILGTDIIARVQKRALILILYL